MSDLQARRKGSRRCKCPKIIVSRGEWCPRRTILVIVHFKGFPDRSVGKESACNSGDPSLIPGSGRSAAEGIGYPLQNSWTSLMAQLVKNLPVCLQCGKPGLGRSPGEGKAARSSVLTWRIPWTVHLKLQCYKIFKPRTLA